MRLHSWLCRTSSFCLRQISKFRDSWQLGPLIDGVYTKVLIRYDTSLLLLEVRPVFDMVNLGNEVVLDSVRCVKALIALTDEHLQEVVSLLDLTYVDALEL